jgi:hypothetical protein
MALRLALLSLLIASAHYVAGQGREACHFLVSLTLSQHGVDNGTDIGQIGREFLMGSCVSIEQQTERLSLGHPLPGFLVDHRSFSWRSKHATWQKVGFPLALRMLMTCTVCA